MLNLFKKTLSEISRYSHGATFYFFTVEGTRFLKYFEKNNNKINGSGLRAEYDSTAKKYGVGIKGKVKIEISKSIVRPQREFLVDLSDLSDTISNIKVKEGIIEKYLTEDEKNYGQCSVYGSARIN